MRSRLESGVDFICDAMHGVTYMHRRQLDGCSRAWSIFCSLAQARVEITFACVLESMLAMHFMRLDSAANRRFANHQKQGPRYKWMSALRCGACSSSLICVCTCVHVCGRVRRLTRCTLALQPILSKPRRALVVALLLERPLRAGRRESEERSRSEGTGQCSVVGAPKCPLSTLPSCLRLLVRY